MQLDLHEELCSYLRALLKAIMGGWGGEGGESYLFKYGIFS